MSETVIINTLEQLKPFLNDQKVLEIVARGEKKRIKTFQKVMLSELPQNQGEEMMRKAIYALNKNSMLNQRNLELISQVAKSQKIGLLLNGLNLCATCAGFVVVCEKLDKMSADICQKISQLQNVVKQGHDIQAEYEFNKVLAVHTDMLDSRRKQQPYSEEKMRELVDSEYNVLAMLISVFKKDVSSDHQSLIFSIFSLLSMFTVSMKFFDEIYYSNNHKVLQNENVWHSSHEKWMEIYNTLLSNWFKEKLQDFGMFESGLTILGIDVYYTGLLDQVFEFREEVEDNQELLLTLGDIELLHNLQELNLQEVKDSIQSAFKENCDGLEEPEILAVYEKALQQLTMG